MNTTPANAYPYGDLSKLSQLSQPQLPVGTTPQMPMSAQEILRKQQEETYLKQGKFGFDIPTAKLGIDALSGLGGLYLGLKGISAANKQFDFQKEFANANMANQIRSYNTALEDRITSRAAQQGNMSQQQVNDYMNANKQTR